MKRNESMFFVDLLRDFYNSIEAEDRTTYYDGCLQELERREKERPANMDENLWNLTVWCDIEELPPFVAPVMHKAGCDIEQVLIDLLTEQQQLDRDAYEDYIEQQRAYREIQGWH